MLTRSRTVLFLAGAMMVAALGLAWPLRADEAPGAATDAAIRSAIQRALPPLESGASGYVAKVRCFSCHHQAVGVLAFTLARKKGFAVSEEVYQSQLRQALNDLKGDEAAYRAGRGQGGGTTRAGYSLWTLTTGGVKPDATTGAVASFLVGRDADTGFWRTNGSRPPTEASSFTSTFLALRGLSAYATPELQERVEARRKSAREWVLKTQAKDHEDRVFRLRTLAEVGAPPEEIKAAVDAFWSTQRADGGWGQLPDAASDAYATGTALAALREVGGVPAESATFRKGLQYLLATQLPDGTWKVTSRSKPFQPYFESGFPHGKDQWISMAASGWAVVALAHALPGK